MVDEPHEITTYDAFASCRLDSSRFSRFSAGIPRALIPFMGRTKGSFRAENQGKVPMQVIAAPIREIAVTAALDSRWIKAHWFALYTRSRHEKFVDQELTKKGLETFLPLRKVIRHWSDRRKILLEPLFSGYLFVRLPLKDRWNVLNTKGVVRFVGPSSARPVEVREGELDAIRKGLEAGVLMDPFPYLKQGMRVYVRSGPMKGTEGFIVRKDDHCRLIISVESLMRSVAIEIDQASVEPV